MLTPSNPIKGQQRKNKMIKPKTSSREKLLEYMASRTPSLNSKAAITQKELDIVLNAFDNWNDYQTVTTIAKKTNMSQERTKTICFKLCLLSKLKFETRETNSYEFKNGKHGRSLWVFKSSQEKKPIRLVPNTPLFSVPESSRDRLDITLEKLKDDLRRYGVECDTLKIGDVLQIHVKGTNGGLLVAAKHMAQRSF